MDTNKTLELVAKIFIIIGMVTGFWSILPLIFGFIALSKMKKGQMTLVWKVLTLIFVNLVAGIILLVMPAIAPKAENNNTAE
jgi:hypothetical protein